jgi:DNA-binding response OmpR family regulator
MKTILAVEDSRLVLNMLSTVLRAKGFEVLEAHNGCEALSILDDRQVDLVITDLIMPGMDGFELTREIRRRRAETIPVLMQSTQTDDRVKMIGREAGVSAWIKKPFLPEELTAAARSLIRS